MIQFGKHCSLHSFVIRRVHKNIVKLPALCSKLPQCTYDICLQDLSVIYKFCMYQIVPNTGSRFFVLFHKYSMLTSPAQSLDPDGSAACEQVQKLCPRNFMLDHIKQRFLNAVLRRSRVHSFHCFKPQTPGFS